MTTTGNLPPGTTIYECPLCDWTHAQEPPALPEFQEDHYVFASAAGWLTEAEAAANSHLAAHELIEWVTEVSRLREHLGAAQYDRASAIVGKGRSERDAVLVAAVLVRRLGGTAEITDAELAAESGTLVRIPSRAGMTLKLEP